MAPAAALLLNNFDWMRGFSLPRVPPRRRQALPRQRDARQGLGQRPPRTRKRHQLHRVQLHAPPGLRLRPSQPAARLRAANRRQRPVGQHHRRHRPRPPHARRPALRPDLPAACSSPTARRWARPSAAPSVSRPSGPAPTPSTSTGSTSPTPTPAAACGSSPSCRTRRSKRSTPPAPAEPHQRESQKRLAEELTRLIHGEAGLAAAQQGHRDLLRRRDRQPDRRPARRHLCRRAEPRRCRAIALAGDGLPLVDALRRSRPGQEQRRSPPHHRARRRLRQQPPARRREHPTHRRRPRQRNGDGAAQREEEIRTSAQWNETVVATTRRLSDG